MTSVDTEQVTITKLENGGKEAFERFVKEHAGWMLKLAKQLTNCDDDAADCVQDTFTIILKKIGDFEGRSSLKTWLYRIVVNQALMKVRKKTNLREQSLDEYLSEFDVNGLLIGPVRMSEESVESLVSKKNVAEKVRIAISESPNNYRLVLMLRDIEGFSTIETANMLDIEIGTARTRLHRARQALKKILEPILGVIYLDDIL